MVVAPLILMVGGVLLLTPKDILRQSVLPAVAEEPRAAYVDKAPVDLEAVRISEASLVVTPTVIRSSPASTLEGSTISGEAAALPTGDRRWITARALNLRTGPGVGSELIASLPFGTAVEVLETSGTWAHVTSGGVSGWLSANFLTTTDPDATASID
jgi:uncharacterized protein YgiM (DUF1202 family)